MKISVTRDGTVRKRGLVTKSPPTLSNVLIHRSKKGTVQEVSKIDNSESNKQQFIPYDPIIKELCHENAECRIIRACSDLVNDFNL